MAEFEGVYNSNGRCQIRWMENRRRSQVLPIPYTQDGIKKAYRVRAQYIKAWQAGEETERGTCPTFQHFAKVKLESANWRANTVTQFKHNMNKHWVAFSKRPINTIHYDELLQHFAPLLSGQASPNQLRSIIYAGSGVFRLAIKSGWIERNAAKMLIEDVGKSTKKIDPFTPAERDKLLSALKGTALLYWTIRFFMGLRPGEVLALTWPDVRGVFSVTKSTKNNITGPTKTDKEREVPIHPKVAALLKTHPRRFDCANVITSRQGKQYYTSRWMNEALIRQMNKHGIRHRSPYNARHSCAAMMLSGGMEPNRCAEFLGHSLKTFWRDYASLISDGSVQVQADIWARLE